MQSWSKIKSIVNKIGQIQEKSEYLTAIVTCVNYVSSLFFYLLCISHVKRRYSQRILSFSNKNNCFLV